MNLVPNDFSHDIAAIGAIGAVSTILEVVCRTTGLGFSAVARVTDDRWIACAVRDEIAFGLTPGGELKLETTLCDQIRRSGRLIVIDHAAEDDLFREHPTPRMYGFQSYISVPIRLRDGRFFGTLCAIDARPARLNTPETVGMFELFAELIAFHLDAHERIDDSEAALLTERQHAELRDEFIAVLGHDLRNPLSAVLTGAKTLLAMNLGERAARVATVIDRSASRMAGLVDNVLDFARGRFGGGLHVTRVPDMQVAAILDQVVTELRTAQPDRLIHSELRLDRPLVCDRVRLAQLLSNLLANALAHGEPDRPVWVRAACTADVFELSVSNQGPPIPPETVKRLFRPFARGADGPGREGLGLGLYIAAEVAKAHEGTLDVSSGEGETRFTFRMPTGDTDAATDTDTAAV